jgi:hypothetical protein
VLFQHKWVTWWIEERTQGIGKGRRGCKLLEAGIFFLLEVMQDDAYVCRGGYWVKFVPVEDCYGADASVEDAA